MHPSPTSRRPSAARALPFAALVLALFAASARAQAFTELTPGLAAPPNPCAAWGDFDGDGDLDLLIAGLGKHDIAFTILYRNDAGTFTDSGIAILGLSRASAAWGDFDGDGDLDLAMTGLTTAGSTATRIYRNDGGTFTLAPGSLVNVFGGSVAWGDYDGDGDLDLLVTGVTSSVAGVGVAATRLYRNDNGTFTSVPHPFPNCYVGAVAWGDYDGDGRLDVVIDGSAETGALSAAIWHNDGGGVFTDAGANLPGTDLGPAAWGDCDGDGDLDLLFGGNSTGFITRVYRNDGGTFTDTQANLLGLIWASAGWGDFDNDGDLDILVSGYDPVAQVRRTILYRNDAGTFVDAGLPFHDLFLGTLSWGDFDGDGDLDLLLAGNELGKDLMLLYRNNAASANASPAPPSGLAVDLGGPDALLSWSAGADDHAPPPGLTYNVRVGTTPGGSEIVSPEALASGRRRVPANGNTGPALRARLHGLQTGVTYYWSVQSIDPSFAGSAFAPEASFTCELAGVGPTSGPGVRSLRVSPNPFTRGTTLRLAGRTEDPVRMRIFDTNGRLVRDLGPGEAGPGGRFVGWDGRDAAGAEVKPGIYLVRAAGGSARLEGRLVKLR